ncbi:ribonuclease Z [Mariniphaga sediminis]|uniref:Ribonuclease Z n=1 Tax=Mariniphaga sediminis TaxID=1628158 RepID=A0A399CW96_9BACT|nr:ribonuclease Z [Mariniphaga sediminis]RIH63667.1 ribonuclease Z [Mariniphaga sediminis]
MPFELTILGSSSAIPTSERYPTAQVLNVLGRFFLIDCGEGTQIQIRRQKIAFGKIKHIFISHLHGDHFYGLIGLISTFNLLGLKNDIHIYSPSQLKDVIQTQLDFLKGEMQFKVIFHPLNFKKPQLIFEDKKVEVISFPLKHSINCCGFLFREKPKEANIKKECIEQYQIPVAQIRAIKQGADFLTAEGEVVPNAKLTTPPPPPRSYAFCSDTAFYPQVVETIQGVNLLYHEATFTEELRDWAERTYHSTALDAAKTAQMAHAGKLIIGHFSTRYKEVEPFLEEAQTIFSNTEVAIDGKTYSVKK